MSLTSCIKKAGDALTAQDRDAILAAAAANRSAGMTPAAAAAKAVTDQIGQVQQLLQNPPAQTKGDQARGTFTPSTNTIALLARADLSTFLHESGHFYLEVLADLASQPDAPAEIVEDMGKVLDWFGIRGDEAVGGSAGGGPLEQSAFHGTPHRGIEKFSTDKIGTGEGAQAYGWGLYFASKREIAEWYRRGLSRGTPTVKLNGRTIKGDVLNTIADRLNDTQDTITKVDVLAEIDRRLAVYAGAGEVYAKWAVKELQDARKKVDKAKSFEVIVSSNPGQLYEVEVPEDENLLMWDKPLSEQPAAVREAIDKLYENGAMDDDTKKFLDRGNARYSISGRKLYEALATSDNLANDGTGKAVSEALAAVGIRGIKYLDGTSRAAGDGSYNYVVFSGDDVQIKGQFYQGQDTPPAEPVQPQRTPLETWRAMSLDQQREYHEKFARGFEAWLFEGRAPSTALGRIFGRFKSWLTAVYKSIKNLNVDLNPDVRGVFDRLLASQEEIRRAEAARELSPLFKSAADGGMTEAEWQAYQDLGREATGEAVDQLQARSLRDMRWLSNARGALLRKMQRDAEDKRRAVREEVTAEVDAMPLERARAALAKLAETDPETKAAIKAWEKQRDAEFDAQRAAVKAEYLALQPDLKGLAKGQYLAKQKRAIENEAERRALEWERANPKPIKPKAAVDMDVVAEAHGFPSGADLARALAESPDRRDMIAALTDQRMLERYGDLADQRGIERAVDEVLHNDARARFVATEVAALDKAVGSPRVLLAAAKNFAANLIGRKLVRDVKVGPFSAAEVRAAREAGSTKNVAERADAKRAQLMNHYAAREAARTLDEIDKGVEYLRKFDKASVRAGLPAEYTDQIDALLERFDLKPSTTLKEIGRRKALATWLAEQNELGIEPDIPPALLETVGLQSYKELTVTEFRGLVDTVRQIEHLGRFKSKLLTAKDQREFDAVKQTLLSSIAENARGRVAGDTRTANTLTGQALQGVKAFGAAHIKAATWARALDGGKDGGPLWEYLIRTANEAGDRETTMRAEATEKLAAMLKPLLETGAINDGKGQTFAGFHTPLNREARIAVALNWGNEGNRQRLMGGENVNAEQVGAVLSTLTAAEWQFVQQVWDFFETYRPEIAAKERRVYGREPQWVEPAPISITTADGVSLTLRGGYYPIKYDPRASERAEAHNEAEEAKNLMRAAYTSATTRRSFTKTRAEAVQGQPLRYSLDGLYSGVQEVIHDLAWHEFLIDANRIVRDKEIAGAIRTTWGPDVHQQFKAWLQDVALGEKPARDAGERTAAWLRHSVSISGLGLNVMNALIQPLGVTQTIVRIGPTWAARGIARTIGSPFTTTREITERSEFMARRFQTQMREVNELRNQVKGQTRARRALDASAYALMLYMQRTVDVPTWWGAYEKAMAEGNTEERAAALADQAVIDSQGSGMVKDLSAIERGGPALKLFTTFYSFFNTGLNLGVGQTMTAESKAKLAADYLLLFTVPALLGALLKDALTPGDSGDDDPEKLARKMIGAQISYLLGTVVFVRELGPLANIAEGNPFGQDYQGPGGTKIFGDAAKLAQQVKQGEADDGLRKAIVNLAGDLLRLPSAQINRSITGFNAIREGKTANPAALLLGYQEPH